jgi:hypothetical protein
LASVDIALIIVGIIALLVGALGAAIIGAIGGLLGSIGGNYLASRWEYRSKKKHIIEEKVLDRRLDVYSKLAYVMIKQGSMVETIIQQLKFQKENYELMKILEKKVKNIEMETKSSNKEAEEMEKINLKVKANKILVEKFQKESKLFDDMLSDEYLLTNLIFAPTSVQMKWMDVNQSLFEITSLSIKFRETTNPDDFDKIIKSIKEKESNVVKNIRITIKAIKDDAGIELVDFSGLFENERRTVK